MFSPAPSTSARRAFARDDKGLDGARAMKKSRALSPAFGRLLADLVRGWDEEALAGLEGGRGQMVCV
jgi:hypothetical protein